MCARRPMGPLVAALDFMMLWNSVVGFSFARAVRPKAIAIVSNDKLNVLRIHPPLKGTVSPTLCAQYIAGQVSLSARLSTFPTIVLGSSARNSMCEGTL